ncbi:MAG: hypothetical protein L3J67_10535 [Hyphomicrobiaceae bacterium]|nr:hypothetical protein [Hyphomicrobiaceae bacterium]
MATKKQTTVPTMGNQLGLIGLYVLAILALLVYQTFCHNEYIWMHAQTPSLALPLDPDLAFKRGLFGIPALLLSLATLARAFTTTGTTGRLFAVLFGIGTAWVLLT